MSEPAKEWTMKLTKPERDAIIEECARQLEAFGGINGKHFFQPQIAAIRALKEKL